ncbi:MAG TPA: metallophosphoesterase [Planctomycetaceae bacterium]|nr:metallophosphoesterase [Planctomycetaceae bacterium]
MCEAHLSRREILTTSFSVLLFPPVLQSSNIPQKELDFLVVTDTHLGYKDQEAAARQWEKTATELKTEHGDFILHLGDVVDGGREAQYPIYKKIRDSIGKPVFEIPGNHDPADLFSKYLRNEIDIVIDREWLRILLLNNAHTDSHDGFLTSEQIGWINQQCSDAAKSEKQVLICMHVPAHTNKHPDRGWYVKPKDGQVEFYALLDKHKDQILALFHGHFHNGLRGWDDRAPIHEICFPSVLYNLNRKLEEQHAPGYNPLEFRPGHTRVTVNSESIRLDYKPVGVDVSVSKQLR